MRLRRFTAADTPAAMAQVRSALGEDAIILATEYDKSRRSVTVTAAIEEDFASPPAPSILARQARRVDSLPPSAGVGANPQVEQWQDALSLLFRYHAVPEPLVGRLVYKARRIGGKYAQAAVWDKESALSSLLADCFRFEPLPLDSPQRLMLAGPPGIGKTLSTARLATQLARKGARVTVITTDTQRAGGVQQLSAFTDILELPLIVADSPEELSRALRAVPRESHALIDTAGCNPYAAEERAELSALLAVEGFEPVLTLPAGMDAHEAADTARAFAHPRIKRLLATRLDAARRFGGLIAAADAGGLAFAHGTDSARIGGELAPLTSPALARRLLKGYEER